ncbi:unnamed protein product, partial [Urochloa humidicola]
DGCDENKWRRLSTAERRGRAGGLVAKPSARVHFGSPPHLTNAHRSFTMAAAAAAAHLLCPAPAASPAKPRQLPTRGRRTYRAKPSRCFSCRASLGPDGSLAMLGAPSPRPAPPLGRPYLREHSCLIFPPSRGRRPLALIKFLGGAFIGAVPEVTYGYLLELLAREGFLVVCVPYNVTFDHEAAAREVFGRFHACYDALLASGLPVAGLSAPDIAELPLYSVGHSNGALLQLLVGSYFSEKIPKANAIVSFNNRPASEAVPYFEQIGPLFSQLMPMMEASPVYSVARNASGDAWKALFDLAGGVIREYDQEAMVSLSKFVDQLPSVMNQDVKWQVGSEYTPADALAQGLKSLALNETRVLSRTIADWFRSL